MAKDFNGTTDRIDWASVANLTGHALTISMWVYCDAYAHVSHLFNAHNATDNGLGICVYIGTDNVLYYYRAGSTALFKNSNDAFGTGGWKHLLITHDGTFTDDAGVNIYFNGTANNGGGQHGVAPETASTGKWSIGGRYYDDARNLDGKIALVGVWDAVVDAATIAGLADGKSPQFYPTNLIFYSLNGATTANIVTGTAAETVDGTSAYADPDSTHPVIESESITLSESIGKLLANYTASVHEDVTLTANISEGDIAVQEPEEGETLSVNLHDDVTVTESQSFLSPTPKLVSPHEDITITENDVEFLVNYVPNVHEDVTVTDSLPGYHKDTIFVFESVRLSTFPTLTVNVHEDITLTADISEGNIDIQAPSDATVNVHEDITVTENNTAQLANYIPSVHDDVTITDSLPGYHKDTIFVFENVSVAAPYIPLYITVSDTVTLDETVDTAIDESFFLSVSDRIRVVEPPFYVLETFVIDVHEDITLTESIVSFQVPVSDRYVEVNENISISESNTVSLLLAGVAVHDDITITESVIASSYPDLSVVIEPENIYAIGVRIYP